MPVACELGGLGLGVKARKIKVLVSTGDRGLISGYGAWPCGRVCSNGSHANLLQSTLCTKWVHIL